MIEIWTWEKIVAAAGESHGIRYLYENSAALVWRLWCEEFTPFQRAFYGDPED